MSIATDRAHNIGNDDAHLNHADDGDSDDLLFDQMISVDIKTSTSMVNIKMSVLFLVNMIK